MESHEVERQVSAAGAVATEGMRPRGLDVGETWVYRTRLEEVVGSPCNCVRVVVLDGKRE